MDESDAELGPVKEFGQSKMPERCLRVFNCSCSGAGWVDAANGEFLDNVHVNRLADDAFRVVLDYCFHACLFLDAAQDLAWYIAETNHFVVGLRYLGLEGLRVSNQNALADMVT